MTSKANAIKFQFLSLQINGPVAAITLDRPHLGNRITPDLAAEFHDACRLTRQGESVRVLVVTGSGDFFSVGREKVPEYLAASPVEDRIQWLQQLQVAQTLASLPMPVIVSINGDALDHGLELALAGDLRICAQSARFGFPALAQENEIPRDGGTQRLPRLVGPGWASDLLLTSRIIDAPQALEIGLVNRVVPREDLAGETSRLAAAVANAAPIAARYAKEAIHRSLDLGLAEGLKLEADLNILLHSTDDRAEGLRSFTEKRPPQFTGR